MTTSADILDWYKAGHNAWTQITPFKELNYNAGEALKTHIENLANWGKALPKNDKKKLDKMWAKIWDHPEYLAAMQKLYDAYAPIQDQLGPKPGRVELEFGFQNKEIGNREVITPAMKVKLILREAE